MKRRQFLATGSAALASAPFVRGQGKTDRKFRTALIGSGWWGMNILREALAAKRTEVVALCDVDADVLEACADEVLGLTGHKPRVFGDYREMLAAEKPEIVLIATPDHWHALPAIAALEAGAHLFLEKPTGHTIGESQAILATARASGKVVQMGMHRRIGPHHVSGMKFLRDGGAGKVGMVRMFIAGGGGEEAPAPNSKAPENLDWDFYCGPAPLRPFNRKIHPGGWRNFLDFANGTLGDWGVHWLDQVLWWSGEKGPKRVFSAGGRPISGPPVLNESEQTTDAPDTQVATFAFDSFTATWEHRKYAGTGAEKTGIGCYYYGTKGIFHMGWRDGWTFFPAHKGEPEIHEAPKFDHEPDGHNVALLWADFLKAIDTGSRPAADIEVGHRATTMSLLGMLALKHGKSIDWDPETERIEGDPAASALLRREYRGPWEYPGA